MHPQPYCEALAEFIGESKNVVIRTDRLVAELGYRPRSKGSAIVNFNRQHAAYLALGLVADGPKTRLKVSMDKAIASEIIYGPDVEAFCDEVMDGALSAHILKTFSLPGVLLLVLNALANNKLTPGVHVIFENEGDKIWRFTWDKGFSAPKSMSFLCDPASFLEGGKYYHTHTLSHKALEWMAENAVEVE